MSKSAKLSWLAAAIAAAFLQLPKASADDVGRQPEFMRLTAERGQPTALETAITRYRSDDEQGATVDLIGAVHIGEAAYYEKLNRLFLDYDVVLYELVAPIDAPAPAAGMERSSNPLTMLQGSMQSMLGLESQLQRVDYTKPNFVRADMTPAQIGKKMAERGETPFTIALSTLADMMRQQNLASQPQDAANDAPQSLFDMVDAFGDPLRMKRMLASQFTQTGSLDMTLGSSLNQMLVIDRNAEAMKGLQKQLADGKRKIGIFYGAAHMPDFDRRLQQDFGLKRQDQRWIVAWDLAHAKPVNPTEPMQLMFQLLKTLDQ